MFDIHGQISCGGGGRRGTAVHELLHQTHGQEGFGRAQVSVSRKKKAMNPSH